MKRDLKNKKRQKQRILRRVSRLATADIVQALLDRGVALHEAVIAASAAEPAAPSAASGSGGPTLALADVPVASPVLKSDAKDAKELDATSAALDAACDHGE